MNWLKKSDLAEIAKYALLNTQKKIDALLDIKDENESPPAASDGKSIAHAEDFLEIVASTTHDSISCKKDDSRLPSSPCTSHKSNKCSGSFKHKHRSQVRCSSLVDFSRYNINYLQLKKDNLFHSVSDLTHISYCSNDFNLSHHSTQHANSCNQSVSYVLLLIVKTVCQVVDKDRHSPLNSLKPLGQRSMDFFSPSTLSSDSDKPIASDSWTITSDEEIQNSCASSDIEVLSINSNRAVTPVFHSISQFHESSKITSGFKKNYSTDNIMSQVNPKLMTVNNAAGFHQRSNDVPDNYHKLQNVVKEKDEIIKQLLEEGEKLSRKELNCLQAIKKLRTTVSENETVILEKSKRITELTNELQKINEEFQESKNAEEFLREQLHRYEKNEKKYLSEIHSMKVLQEEAEDQLKEVNAALEHAHLELFKVQQQTTSEIESLSSWKEEFERILREEFDSQQQESKRKYAAEQRALLEELQTTKSALSIANEKLTDISSNHAHELAVLLDKLHILENKNEALSLEISIATAPYIREIEDLHNKHTVELQRRDEMESTLHNKIVGLDEQLLILSKKESQFDDLVLKNEKITRCIDELKSKNEALMLENTNFKFRVESLQSEMTKLKSVMLLLEAENSNLKNSLTSHEMAASKVKDLENELLSEKGRVEELIATIAKKNEEIKRIETANDIGTRSRKSSFSIAKSSSVYDSLRASSSIVLIESLQSNLKEKDGEIALLQMTIGELEKSRSSMAAEIGNYCRKAEEANAIVEANQTLQKQYQEVYARYNALLQMYGEKQEEVEELRMDLQDTKAIYRSQIEQLLKNSD